MAKQLQLRRGNTSDNTAFTGEIGELTLDTSTKQIRVHDGVTQGGCGIIDQVVGFQVPTAANNYTWYRKYASGWVEQGGQGVASSGITYVTLPVQMASIAYTATGSISYSGTSEGTIGFQFVKQKSSLGIGARYNGIFNNGLAVDWQVSGMAA